MNCKIWARFFLMIQFFCLIIKIIAKLSGGYSSQPGGKPSPGQVVTMAAPAQSTTRYLSLIIIGNPQSINEETADQQCLEANCLSLSRSVCHNK